MNAQKKIKYFRHRPLEDWFNDLIKASFLKFDSDESIKTYYLKPPLQIFVKKKVVSSLNSRYKSDYEIGGILLAEPAKIGLVNILLVNGVRYIRNISSDPGVYQANISMKKYVHRCFTSTKSGKRYLPIKFHSHPRESYELPEMFMTFFQMSTSESDKKAATKKYKFTSKKTIFEIALPSMLCIVSEDHGVFLGVYGGNIAPDDFIEYGEKLLGKMADETINRGFKGNSLFKKITGVISALGITIVSAGFQMSNPQLRSFAMQLTLLRKTMKTDNNYFTLVQDKDAVIDLPN